ncbi:MAG TPA: hypothetical protein VI819_05755 [Patescibacteria group bacterium]|nr:hypothetical protein [Patescibacteria group bacterium]
MERDIVLIQVKHLNKDGRIQNHGSVAGPGNPYPHFRTFEETVNVALVVAKIVTKHWQRPVFICDVHHSPVKE